MCWQFAVGSPGLAPDGERGRLTSWLAAAWAGLSPFSVFATYFWRRGDRSLVVRSTKRVWAGALVDPIGYAGAIVIVGLLFARALWSRGLTTFRRSVSSPLLTGSGAPGGRHLAAGLDHLGRRPDTRLRPSHEPQLRPRSRKRPSRWPPCWWQPTPWLADCWPTPLPIRSRASPSWPD